MQRAAMATMLSEGIRCFTAGVFQFLYMQIGNLFGVPRIFLNLFRGEDFGQEACLCTFIFWRPSAVNFSWQESYWPGYWRLHHIVD